MLKASNCFCFWIIELLLLVLLILLVLLLLLLLLSKGACVVTFLPTNRAKILEQVSNLPPLFFLSVEAFTSKRLVAVWSKKKTKIIATTTANDTSNSNMSFAAHHCCNSASSNNTSFELAIIATVQTRHHYSNAQPLSVRLSSDFCLIFVGLLSNFCLTFV